MRILRVYIRALRILWTEERALTFCITTACAAVGLIQVAEPVLFGRVIDALFNRRETAILLWLWGALSVLNIGMSVFMSVMSDRLAHRQRLNILDAVFERVIALPPSYHSTQGSGRVVRAILNGTDQLFNLWLSFMREHLASIIGIALLIPLAIGMEIKMAALLFFLCGIYVFANFTILRRTTFKQGQIEVHNQNMFGRISDVIGNVTVVQSYTRYLEEIQALKNIMADILSAQYPLLTWWGIATVITRISSTLTLVSILALGSWLIGHGQLTVGQLVSFTAFSSLLISRMDGVASFFTRVIIQGPSIQNFFNLLDQPGAAHELPHAKPLKNCVGAVKFQNVTYRHPNSSAGVFDLDFVIPAGTTVALVGPSGAGKTTTIALLQRLFDPDVGEILVDGENIRDFTLASLRHSLATVFQDAGLFNRSISENIRVGRPNATDAEVQEAARQADAHDFIMAKPGGYQFTIGERGSALSGGERQRLAIARAILKNAPILLFDEATSALDNETEKRIQLAIAHLHAQKKTTFIIAHRLSTVVSADLILVFEDGRIIQKGSFSQLRACPGLFADLIRAGALNLDQSWSPETLSSGARGPTGDLLSL